MVSLWSWKSEDNSPASFEKSLATLVSKISKSQNQLESLRLNRRRYEALWTIYTSFAYLLGLILLLRSKDLKEWSIWEFTLIVGCPVLFYSGRIALASYYTYRIDITTHGLNQQQAERFETIEKLKAATKYNTTQELLEKYGSIPESKKQVLSKHTKVTDDQRLKSPMKPPLTANIPRPGITPEKIPKNHESPNRWSRKHGSPTQTSPSKELATLDMPGPPEFAPNAFPIASEYDLSVKNIPKKHWYDRVFDLLLGEDETLPINRVVLICQSCRLVNGQAPPGIKSLVSLGTWKCIGCHSINGEEAETDKFLKKTFNGARDSKTDSGMRINEAEDRIYRTEATDSENDTSTSSVEIQAKKNRPKT